MIKCPWDVIDDKRVVEHDDHKWVPKYLLDKGVPLEYLKAPSKPETDQQVRAIVEYLCGSRNFILLMSQDSSYIKSLYFYIAATWVTTKETGFEIVDITAINNFDRENLIVLEQTGLLILPYVDPTDYNLRRTKNIVGNTLSKRKSLFKPTLLDTFVKAKDSSLDAVETIAPIYGDQSVPMFLKKSTNSKIIKVKDY